MSQFNSGLNLLMNFASICFLKFFIIIFHFEERHNIKFSTFMLGTLIKMATDVYKIHTSGEMHWPYIL